MSIFGGDDGFNGDDQNGFGNGGEDDGDFGFQSGNPPWMGNEITLYDEFGEPLSYTFEQWFNLALEDKETLLEEFNMDNLDILYQLDDLGYMTEEDWRNWRDQYAAYHS